MNVRELMRLTLGHLGEETDEYTTEEFRFSMLAAFNRAYMEIMRNKRKPERRETVALEDGCFDMGKLAMTCVSICAVTALGREAPFSLEEDGCVRVDSEAAEAQVRYRYLPPMLAAEEDIPRFPAEFHAALADYAAYMALGGTARQPRAEFYMRNYLQTYARIPPERMATAITQKW